MKRRILSIITTLALCLSLCPTWALAAEGEPETLACICEELCTEDSVNESCPVCGMDGADSADCNGKQPAPDQENGLSVISYDENEYSQNDVAVINAIIDNNGLSATKDDPASWTFATWDDSSPKRITRLSLGSKSLTGTLDVSGLSSLTTLFCNNNQLGTLDVSGLSSLTTLFCDKNQLGTLDVSGLASLTVLNCSRNQLGTLDVSGLSSLTELDCSRNQLGTLDVSDLSSLAWLYCNNNQLGTLDVSGLASMTRLDCNDNQLGTLNVSGLSSLTVLNFGNNPLVTLDCSDTQLRTLDVSYLLSLTYLNCSNNQLGTLDVSKNTALTRLNCSDTQLRTLDVSYLLSLTDLDCSNNQLGTLDVSKNTALTRLNCSDTQLRTLDVSGLSSLTTLSLEDNPLTSFTSKEGKSLTITPSVGGTVKMTSVDLTDGTTINLTVTPDPGYIVEWTGLPEGTDTSADAVTFILNSDVTVKVKKLLTDDMIAAIPAQTYTGSAIEPALTVTDGSPTIIQQSDYTVSYTDNTEVGTATATITATADGNYSGSASKTFTISAKPLAGAEVEVTGTFTYTGSAQEPAPTVTLDGKTLTADTDYTVAYTDNTNAGTAKITVTGTGNYSGTAQGTFTIGRATPTITWGSTTQELTYTGSAAAITTPTVTLVNNEQFTGTINYSYTGTTSGTGLPTNAGTYTIKAHVDAAGNYNASDSTNELMLTIKKDTSATPPGDKEGYELDYAQETITVEEGYEVSTAQDGGAAVPSGSITDHLGQTLYIRKVEDDNHAASGWTAFTLAARPAAPSLTKTDETLKGKADGQLTGDASGTEYSTDGGTTWKDYADGAFTGLAGGTTVQVRVKAAEAAPHGEVSSCTIEPGPAATVTFISEGSTFAEQSDLSYGDTVSKPEPDPTRTDYKFLGWYKTADGATEWNFAADKVTAGNMTIYAKWKQVNFQVGGTVKDSTGTTAINGATVTLMQGSRQIDQGITDSNGAFTFSQHIPAGAYNIVTASGEQTKTTLITIADSDVNDVAVQLPPEGVSSHLTVSANSNTPAVVVGGLDEEAAALKTDSVSTVTVTMTVEGKTESAVPAEEVTAIKTVAEASGVSDPVVEYLDITVTKEVDGTSETISTTKKVIEIVAPFDFSGKDTSKIVVLRYHGSSAASLTRLNSKPTSGYTDGTFYLDTANGFLYIYATQFSTYAVAYTETNYTITFNANGGTVGTASAKTNPDGTLSTLPTPSRSGYSFTGWYTAASGGTQVTTATVFTKNTTIYAHWQQNTPVDPTIPVTGISLDKSGLTLTAGQTERLTATVRPSNATNKSVVWSTSDLSVAAVDSNGDVTARAPGTAVITVTTRSGSHKATCTVTVVSVSYTVTYDPNGGTGTMTAGTALGGTAFVLPECGFTAPEGKEFDAWAIGSVSGEKAAAGSSHMFTADTTVYAIWKDAAAENFKITYHANGGTGTMAGSTVRKGAAFTLPGCGFTPPVGKVLDAWAINSSSGERVEAGSAQMFTADTALYALWKDAPAVTYTIVYSANGGTGTMADGIAPDGEPFVLPECGFTPPEGKAFAGWSIGGTIVEAGGSYTFTSDTTVLAVWKDAEAVTYRVAFLPNGGTGAAPTVADMAEGGMFQLPANPFSREGYQFTGWSYGGTIYQPGDTFTMPDHDVTFSAQWNPIAYAITGRVLQKGVSVPGVTVRLMLGSTEIARCVTGEGGRFAFEDVPSGIYNLVAEKDGVTKTVMQEIVSSGSEITIELPIGKTNSVVEVKDKDTPPVVVGGLENIFQDDTLYTNEDKEIVAAGGTVEFKMEVGKRDTLPEGTVIEAIKPFGQIWGLFLDLSITKTVTRLDGTETSSPVTEAGHLITTRIPLPVELQGKDSYAVYRVHNGVAEALPNSGSGERYEVSPDRTVITIFAQKYSTYAIAWSSETPPTPPVNPSWPTGGGSSGSSVKTYAITVEKSEHGAVTASRINAASGTTVTLTVTPDTGYVLLDLAVTDSQGSQINLTDKNTFTMPARAVTVTATFAPLPDENQEQPCDGGADCPSRSFTDLGTVGTWYHEAVDYVLRNGLMNGHDNGLFGPDDGLTRAQLAQILHNLKGRPVVNYLLQFEDVPSGAWYTEAVRWAASTGIVGGYGNGLFGPDDKITREQLAVMLWRYAGSPAATDRELHFSDANQASGWALEALRWAVENGIINGKGGGILDPTGPATRAEAAEMLKNFLENQ